MSHADRMRAYRQRARERGLCSGCCQFPPEPGRKQCHKCIIKSAAYIRVRRLEARLDLMRWADDGGRL